MSKLLVVVLMLAVSTFGPASAARGGLRATANKLLGRSVMSPEFKKLDAWLTENLPNNEDPLANLLKLNEHLQAASHSMNEEEVEAWEQFLELHPAAEEEIDCDSSYSDSAIIISNNLIDAGVARTRAAIYEPSTSRVKQIVTQLARKHSRECGEAHVKHLEKVNSRADEQERQITKTFLKKFEALHPMNCPEYDPLNENLKKFVDFVKSHAATKTIAEAVLATAKETLGDDLAQRLSSQARPAAEEAVDKVLKACASRASNLREIFAISNLDAILRPQSGSPYNAGPLVEEWRVYQLCEHLDSYRRDQEALVDAVLAKI